MKSLNSFLTEAKSRTFQRREGSHGTTGGFAGYRLQNQNPAIGWFATKANMAFGWGIFNLDAGDLHWFRKEKASTKNVYRVASDKGTSVVKLNLKTGTVAWLNDEASANDRIKWDRAVKYNRLMIDNEARSFSGFGVKKDEYQTDYG
jgi:hypothetical protein